MLIPVRAAGRERLSAPFSYAIDLVARADGPDVDAAAILEQPARLELLQGMGSRHAPSFWRPIRGMIAEFTEVAHGHDWIRYRAELVPQVWALSLSQRTKVHQHRSVPDLVKGVLTAHGLGGAAVEANLRGRYAEREYILQYREDDLSFIRRLLEHEGIAWYHRHDEGTTVLVLTDHPDGWATVPGDAEIPFRPRHEGDGEPGAADDWFQQEVIDGLSHSRRQVPSAVQVRDWNDRTPGAEIGAEVRVGDRGIAAPTDLWGEHAGDRGEARRLAQVRVEELRSRQAVFIGSGDQRGFRCGHRFTLESHPRSSFAQEYLLVEVEQEITQALDQGEGSSTHYANRFTAIPAGQPWRPPLETPRPVIPGVLTARVDAAGAGTYAEIDEAGRYRVRLHADTADAAAAAASLPVRMAQPHTGPDHGFHLPLHKRAEVLLVHENGDPDRPLIAGTVPNPDTPSVVIGGNQTQSIWRSAGQNEVRFEDLAGSEQVYLHATKDRLTEVANNDTKRTGGDREESVGRSATTTIATTCHVAIGGLYQISVGGAMNETVGGAKAEEVGAAKYETVALERTLEVGTSFTVKIGADHDETATGKRHVKAKSVLIEAQDEIMLSVGKASITLKKSGDIAIVGKDILLKASGKLAGKASGDVVLKGAKSGDN